MSTGDDADRIRAYLAAPTNGIIGLVDILLGISRHVDLRLEGSSTQFRLTLTGQGEVRTHEFTTHRPLVRAMLARVSVLVKEHGAEEPHSPYEGAGVVPLPGEPHDV